MSVDGVAEIEVTPVGLSTAAWAPRIARAPQFMLTSLLADHGIAGAAQLIVVGAHPDDETIGAGRLIRTWNDEVGPTSVVLATAGEACFDHVGPRPEGLAERRLQEWQAALDVLGVSDRRQVLGIPDGLVDARQEQVRQAITDEVARCRDSTGLPVVLAAPWRYDPHPDHGAVGEAAARVAADQDVKLLAFPVWMTYWMSPTDPHAENLLMARLLAGRRVDGAHAAACACFVTQLQPIAPGWGAVVPTAMFAHHDQQLLLTESLWPTPEEPDRGETRATGRAAGVSST